MVSDLPLLPGLFFKWYGDSDLWRDPALADRRAGDQLHGGGRNALRDGDRKSDGEPDIPAALHKDHRKAGDSTPLGDLSGLPFPVYAAGPDGGSLRDDIPDRSYQGNDHDREQSCDPEGDGELQ